MNLEFWQKAFELFLNAPVFVVALAVAAMTISWWFRGVLYDSEKNGLKAQMAALEERLKLAKENEERIAQKLKVTEENASELDRKIRAVPSAHQLSSTSESVVGSLVELSEATKHLSTDLAVSNAVLLEAQSFGISKFEAVQFAMMQFVVWVLAVSTSYFAIASSIGGSIPLNPFKALEVVNSEGSMRDLFYILVPASAIAITALLDIIAYSHKQIPAHWFSALILALIANIISLLSVVVAAVTMRKGAVLPPDVLRTYSGVLFSSLIIGAATVVGVLVLKMQPVARIGKP